MLNLVSLSTQSLASCVNYFCLELFTVFFQHENRFRYKFFRYCSIFKVLCAAALRLTTWLFYHRSGFLSSTFLRSFWSFANLERFTHLSVNWCFQRLLVLFKGFLLRLQKSFFCLSAWRSHIVPYRNHFCKPFLHFFRLFLRFVNYRQFSAGNRRVFWRLRQRRCLPPYIITLYRQRDVQTGIDSGLYYPPESVLRCQDFPCKILSRKISAIFGDCYKTQNIVVFRLTCH